MFFFLLLSAFQFIFYGLCDIVAGVIVNFVNVVVNVS
jgi:hypothetical protein